MLPHQCLLNVLMIVSLRSSHPEVAKTTVHPSAGAQLPHAGAAAHWVAGKGTFWVFCGGFSQKETQQELVLPRSHLSVPKGKSVTILTQLNNEGRGIVHQFLATSAASVWRYYHCVMLLTGKNLMGHVSVFRCLNHISLPSATDKTRSKNVLEQEMSGDAVFLLMIYQNM